MKPAISQFMLRTGIYSGAHSRALATGLFSGLGAQKIVLFSDRGLENAGVVDKVTEMFKSNANGTGPKLVGTFLDITQDAESQCINDATRYAKEVGAEGLLAVGGGSVLDTVKGVKYALHHNLTDIKEAIQGGVLFEAFPNANVIPIPHIAIPTTAGTGSEVSPIAVIFNEELQVKTNLINPFINADIAILDPEMTVGLPPSLTAYTGFDALTHAIEALASPTATALTDAYALQAIRLIEKNLPIVVSDGTNIDARMDMLYGSLMGITAFSFALSAIPVHNFAHAYGALFRIPHGLANAVFLPFVMEALPDLYLPKVKDLAEALRVKVQKAEVNTLVLEKVIAKIRSLQQDTKTPKDFREYNISIDDFERTIAAVEKDPAAGAYPLSKELILSIGKKVVPAIRV